MLMSRLPMRESTSPRTQLESIVYMIRDVVSRLDRLEGDITILRKR